MASTSMHESNPDVKQAVIAFQRPSSRQLEPNRFHTFKLRTPPQTQLHPSTSSQYLSLTREPLKSG
eukprot:734654-Ditylum_brightwellii.AAC.1